MKLLIIVCNQCKRPIFGKMHTFDSRSGDDEETLHFCNSCYDDLVSTQLMDKITEEALRNVQIM